MASCCLGDLAADIRECVEGHCNNCVALLSVHCEKDGRVNDVRRADVFAAQSILIIVEGSNIFREFHVQFYAFAGRTEIICLRCMPFGKNDWRQAIGTFRWWGTFLIRWRLASGIFRLWDTRLVRSHGSVVIADPDVSYIQLLFDGLPIFQ